MPNRTRVRFSTRVDAHLLTQLRALANSEQRQIQDLIEEALNDLLDKRHQAPPRPHAITAYQESHEKFGELYKKLAE